MKRCSKCGETKPLDQFSRDKRTKDGRRSNCKGCQRAYYAGWYADNQARRVDQAFNWNSRYRLRSPDLYVEFVSRWEIFERDNWTCQICGIPLGQDLPPSEYNHPHFPTVDHIVPLARGGEHSYENTRAACKSCNSAKNNPVEEVAA